MTNPAEQRSFARSQKPKSRPNQQQPADRYGLPRSALQATADLAQTAQVHPGVNFPATPIKQLMRLKKKLRGETAIGFRRVTAVDWDPTIVTLELKTQVGSVE